MKNRIFTANELAEFLQVSVRAVYDLALGYPEQKYCGKGKKIFVVRDLEFLLARRNCRQFPGLYRYSPIIAELDNIEIN